MLVVNIIISNKQKLFSFKYNTYIENIISRLKEKLWKTLYKIYNIHNIYTQVHLN